jgi:hypothetical protein
VQLSLLHAAGPPSLSPCAEADFTEAAKVLLALIAELNGRTGRAHGATFILELFRGSPTARNRGLVGGSAG